eukprot:CAMPEP_0113718892 /NCGR_PEP_ID=MMETSP0038_2-20120614/35473_1 /TAXON_ID=2898 /ORGANISM="Cryptomonas paramecium" /LENGTH=173 /DNA_ID=CAMNT_0000647127 /DNA_START=57 /DNA_END=574 /DNA_ORIENTATION=+ /assembly_acc=CAM_ASM_000170
MSKRSPSPENVESPAKRARVSPTDEPGDKAVDGCVPDATNVYCAASSCGIRTGHDIPVKQELVNNTGVANSYTTPIPVVRSRRGLSFDLNGVDPALRRRIESNRRSAAAAQQRRKEEEKKTRDQLACINRAYADLASENNRLRQLVLLLTEIVPCNAGFVDRFPLVLPAMHFP